MSYPMKAFAPVNLATAPAGTLATLHGIWVLKTEPDGQGAPQMLLLTGDDAGAVSGAAGEGLCVADNASWEIFLNDFALDRNFESRPAVSFGADGPIIHGHVWRAPFYGKAFTKQGARLDLQNIYYYATSFSIWLVDESGSKVGDAPLLST